MSAAGGILYVVLALVGNSTGHLEPPPATASQDTMTAYWMAQSTAWPRGAIIGSLAFFCFVFFLGSLYHILRQAEGPSGAFSIVAFAGGLLTAIVQLIEVTRMVAAIQIVQEGGDPMIARALEHMNGGSFVLAWFSLAILLSGTAVVALQTAVLPRWLGWITALLALALLASYIAAIETVLSMLTTGCHFKKVGHRIWQYFQARLGFTMALFNVLAQWHGLQPDEDGFIQLSIAEFSL